MKATMRKKQKTSEIENDTLVTKNKINPKVLRKWLEKMGVNKMPNIIKIDAINLWCIGSIERYRINIWIEEEFENCVYLRNRIANSWFVHYDRSKEKIVNKTIEG